MKSIVHDSNITPSFKFSTLKELAFSLQIILSFSFHFSQLLSNFLKYSFSNFLLFHLYNIFSIYFSGNSPLLKSLSSAISNFSCFLTSAFSLPSNSTTTSFAFSRSSFLSQLSCFAINLFHCTKYFTTLLTFLLFSIFSTSYSFTPSTSTSFTSSAFCPTCSLYHTTQLTFTTAWILIKVGSCSLTTLVETTSSIVYGPTYQSTNFFTGLFLNIKSFVLNITLSPTFHTSASFLSLSACCFISSCCYKLKTLGLVK